MAEIVSVGTGGSVVEPIVGLGDLVTDGWITGFASGSKVGEAVCAGESGGGRAEVETAGAEGVNLGVGCDRQPAKHPMIVANKIPTKNVGRRRGFRFRRRKKRCPARKLLFI
jgi:hypothetical protein